MHRLSRAPRSLATSHYVSNPEWVALHQQFHVQLLTNCPSRWLRVFCATLSTEAYRYRQLAASRNFSSHNEHTEHLALFHAAIEGRADIAVQLLLEHYRRTTKSISENAVRLQVKPTA